MNTQQSNYIYNCTTVHDQRTDKCIDRRRNERTKERMNERLNVRTNEDRKTERYIIRHFFPFHFDWKSLELVAGPTRIQEDSKRETNLARLA